MHCETISTLLRLQAQPNSDCAKLFFLANRQGDLSDPGQNAQIMNKATTNCNKLISRPYTLCQNNETVPSEHALTWRKHSFYRHDRRQTGRYLQWLHFVWESLVSRIEFG